MRLTRPPRRAFARRAASAASRASSSSSAAFEASALFVVVGRSSGRPPSGASNGAAGRPIASAAKGAFERADRCLANARGSVAPSAKRDARETRHGLVAASTAAACSAAARDVRIVDAEEGSASASVFAACSPRVVNPLSAAVPHTGTYASVDVATRAAASAAA